MEKKYTSPAIEHANTRRKIRNYSIIGGAAILGTAAIMYFATRNNSATTQNSTTKGAPTLIIQGDVINSNISVLDLENSELNINGTYHVGERVDSAYQKNAVDSTYQDSTLVSKVNDQQITNNERVVNRGVANKRNNERQVVEFIDDCVDGMDLFQNPILLNDLKKTLYENQKAN